MTQASTELPPQHPNVAPPCWETTGELAEIQGKPEFRCQRGTGHPPPHEVILQGGARMQWGLASEWPDDDEDDDL